MSEMQQSPTDLFIISAIFANVTSRCDLFPLTLNFRSTSGMMCENIVQNSSEIEQSAADLLTI